MRYWLTYLPASRWYGDPPPMQERVRIALAGIIGNVFPPAYYLAPQWKRDMWHRIGCERESCPICDSYLDPEK